MAAVLLLRILLLLLLLLSIVGTTTTTSRSPASSCTFPDADPWPHNATGPFPALDRSLTCAPGSVTAATADGSSFSLPGAAAGFPLHTYVDGRATVYDNALEASFVDTVRPVRAALLKKSSWNTGAPGHPINHTKLMAALSLVKAEGADIVLLTEENFAMEHVADGAGERLRGPRISAVKAAAKQLGLYVIVPFRMQLAAGESYNGAVVVGRDGELVLSTAGVPYYQKVFPCLGAERASFELCLCLPSLS